MIYSFAYTKPRQYKTSCSISIHAIRNQNSHWVSQTNRTFVCNIRYKFTKSCYSRGFIRQYSARSLEMIYNGPCHTFLLDTSRIEPLTSWIALKRLFLHRKRRFPERDLVPQPSHAQLAPTTQGLVSSVEFLRSAPCQPQQKKNRGAGTCFCVPSC
jgi:hypothetical protein